MKGNEALDALVALCDVERVEKKDDGCRKMSNKATATSNYSANSALLGQNFSSVPSQTVSSGGHNYAPYIQFLQSQMINAQKINPIQAMNSQTPVMDTSGLSLLVPMMTGAFPNYHPKLFPPDNLTYLLLHRKF